MHNCPSFKEAIDTEFIRKPGHRLTGSDGAFAKKYFIRSVTWGFEDYRYISHCPFCGKKLNG